MSIKEEMLQFGAQHNGFVPGAWQEEINVSDFILKNYEEYTGDDSFLAGTTEKTRNVMKIVDALTLEETKNGLLDVDMVNLSGINNFQPGYIDKENEVIFGLQTDKPLKRIINLYGGVRMAKKALESYNRELDPEIEKNFVAFRKSHNDGVFDAYTSDIRAARSAGLLTGLPDAYGRGRIIGDYRRVALYGIDVLVNAKKNDLETILDDVSTEEKIRLREEVNEQIRALENIKKMAAGYGFDISKPASNAQEAIQWLYFAYLAAVKENNGAAMSLGRTSTFVDCYIQRDMKNGVLTEEGAQELVDQFVIKLRLIRHLRTPEYNELFAGDPTWVTESVGGMADDNRSLVTKTSFRYLHTLMNLNPSPEPNITVLYSSKLPVEFRKFCAKISILTDSIQYEGDDVMRPIY